MNAPRITHPVALERFRNVGIMAHVDAGKTTLSERVLFYTGVLRRVGSVDAGTTALDDLPQEQAKGITISAAATTTHWSLAGEPSPYRFNLIDTPGHVDFTVEVERSLRVLDGAVAVFDAARGVEPQSETVWRQADRYGVVRIAFVNKMDKAGADFDGAVRSIVERLDARAVPVQRPVFVHGAFAAVVDLCSMRCVRFESGEAPERSAVVFEAIPLALATECALARETLIEAVAEHDDDVLATWVNHGSSAVSEAALVRAIRRATLARAIVPVLCGAAAKNLGVQPLLDAIARYLPSPLDRGVIHGTAPSNEAQPLERAPSEHAPLSALAFKVVHDPFLGALVFTRVYSGVLRRNDVVLEPRKQRTMRVGRVLRVHARQCEEAQDARAGEIVALAGLDGVRTGDTLCDPEAPIALESLVIPAPVVQCTVEPLTAQDRDKLGPALARLAVEDPSLRLSTDPESGATVLEGLGELQLEITLDRLRSDYHVEARAGRPAVAYRETLTKECTIHERFKRQNGGPGLFAEVVLRVRPGARDSGFAFVDRTRGGALTRELAQAVKKGIEGALTRGPLGGHPVVDLEVELIDGATHPTDSTALAFEFAGAEAIKRAFREGAPQRLEPWMSLEVSVPEAMLGAVLGDLAARLGRVRDVSMRDKSTSVIAGEAPMSSLFGYVSDLRGRTHGRGSATIAFSQYMLG